MKDALIMERALAAGQFVGDAFERPGGLIVLTLAGDRLSGMTLFLHDI